MVFFRFHHNLSISKIQFIFFAGLSSRRNGKKKQFDLLITLDFYHLSTITSCNYLLIFNHINSSVYHFNHNYTLCYFYQPNGKQKQYGSLYTMDFNNLSTITGSNQLLIINHCNSIVYHFYFFIYSMYVFDLLYTV